MANIEWIQINSKRFVSKDGNFSIDTNDRGRFVLHAKYNGKNKLYIYEKLESAFWGASNIFTNGRGI